MGKQHESIPNEPQEAPVQAPRPEVQRPNDPNGPSVPQEAPNNEPVEVPQQPAPQPEIKQDDTGSEFNQTEV